MTLPYMALLLIRIRKNGWSDRSDPYLSLGQQNITASELKREINFLHET